MVQVQERRRDHGELWLAQGGEQLSQICGYECKGSCMVRGKRWSELAVFLTCSGIWCVTWIQKDTEGASGVGPRAEEGPVWTFYGCWRCRAGIVEIVLVLRVTLWWTASVSPLPKRHIVNKHTDHEDLLGEMESLRRPGHAFPEDLCMCGCLHSE